MASLTLTHQGVSSVVVRRRADLLLGIAAVLLLLSLVRPYWQMTLHAPQYPSGLHVQVFVNRVEGDVAEIDGLNHYIGMRPLDEAAQLERRVGWGAVVGVALLVAMAGFTQRRWAGLLTFPALTFPLLFLADLWYWLHRFGQGLDPHAPLSSSIKPFTPTVLGTGVIGQFSTTATVASGFYLALLAGGLILTALWLRRRGGER